jgi:hypothetical protein
MTKPGTNSNSCVYFVMDLCNFVKTGNCMSRESWGSKVAGYGLEDRNSIPSGGRIFLFATNSRSTFGGFPYSYSESLGPKLFEYKAITRLHRSVVPRLRMRVHACYTLPSSRLLFGYLNNTNLAYDPSKLTGINLFMLNSNTIYCSIIFANHIESTTFIKILFKAN